MRNLITNKTSALLIGKLREENPKENRGLHVNVKEGLFGMLYLQYSPRISNSPGSEFIIRKKDWVMLKPEYIRAGYKIKEE